MEFFYQFLCGETAKTTKYWLYEPKEIYEQINEIQIDDKVYKLNITFKNVIQIFYLFETKNPQRINKALEILGLKNVKNPDFVLDQIAQYIFDTRKKNGIGKKEQNYDINFDYKHYYPDFLKYNIDLNKEDIDWWSFNSILNAILKDENSNMFKVLSYRNYKKPIKNAKTRENLTHQQMLRLKEEYSLPRKNQNGINNLWNYLEKKVGEKKE